MNFQWAIEQLKKGKKVRREGWIIEQFIYMSDGTIRDVNAEETLLLNCLGNLLADDWELYEEVDLKYGEPTSSGDLSFSSCNHEWIYNNMILLSDPPQQQRICKNCGKQETIVTSGVSAHNDYDEIVKKFEKKTLSDKEVYLGCGRTAIPTDNLKQSIKNIKERLGEDFVTPMVKDIIRGHVIKIIDEEMGDKLI